MTDKIITAEDYTLELDLKRSLLDPKKRHLSITKESIQYESKVIYFRDISDIRYGILQMVVNGIKASKIYEIRLRDTYKNQMRITFATTLNIKNKSVLEIYNTIIDSLWYAYTGKQIDKYFNDLMKGKNVIINQCELTPHGINIRIWKFFSKKTFFIPWHECLKSYRNGFLQIYSSKKKGIKAQMNLMNKWNNVVLSSLLEWLWKEGRTTVLKDKNKFSSLGTETTKKLVPFE